jgi:hypothetical protein
VNGQGDTQLCLAMYMKEMTLVHYMSWYTTALRPTCAVVPRQNLSVQSGRPLCFSKDSHFTTSSLNTCYEEPCTVSNKNGGSPNRAVLFEKVQNILSIYIIPDARAITLLAPRVMEPEGILGTTSVPWARDLRLRTDIFAR